MNPFEWTGETWTAIATIAAVVALFRPDAERALRARRKSARFHPAGLLEIGCSDLGPSIGIIGTVISRGSRRIVTRVTATVTRKRDGAQVRCAWLLLRPLTLTAGSTNNDVQLRFVQPFPLVHEGSETLNIFLNDQVIRKEFDRHIAEVRTEMLTYLRGLTDQSDVALIRTNFIEKSLSIKKFYEVWNELFLWHPGDYAVAIELHDDGGSSEVVGKYEFNLSEHDSRKLKSNLFILEDQILTGSGAGVVQNVFVEYVDGK